MTRIVTRFVGLNRAARVVALSAWLVGCESVVADDKDAVQSLLAEMDRAQSPDGPEGARITAKEAREAVAHLREHGTSGTEAGVLALGNARAIPAVRKAADSDDALAHATTAVRALAAVLAKLDGLDPWERALRERSAADVGQAICMAVDDAWHGDALGLSPDCPGCRERAKALNAAGLELMESACPAHKCSIQLAEVYKELLNNKRDLF